MTAWTLSSPRYILEKSSCQADLLTEKIMILNRSNSSEVKTLGCYCLHPAAQVDFYISRKLGNSRFNQRNLSIAYHSSAQEILNTCVQNLLLFHGFVATTAHPTCVI